jgi:hypothetical protein
VNHFDALVNKLEFIGRDSKKIQVAITDKIGKKSAAEKKKKTNNRRDTFMAGIITIMNI